jgi:hypothetical protein
MERTKMNLLLTQEPDLKNYSTIQPLVELISQQTGLRINRLKEFQKIIKIIKNSLKNN